MNTITIPKTEYKKLEQEAMAYRKFAEKLFESIIKSPIEEIVEDFQKTGLYSKRFLQDLESGLQKSSLAKHGNRTIEARP